MHLKCPNLFFIILSALIALVGCEKAQRMMMDEVPSDTRMDTPPTDVKSAPVKLISFIDYLEGGKEDYIAWVASVAPTLQAPEEVIRIRSYDNIEPDMSPNRLVEKEFGSFTDATTYLNRPEIAAIRDETPNRASKVIRHTFIQDVDSTFAKEEGDWQIKYVYLIDYGPGGKQAYLEWVEDVATEVISPPQLKAVAAYDNYYGESPHRLVEFKFASQEDADAYYALEEVIQTDAAGVEKRAGSWSQVLHRFQLRSDYINE